MQPFFQKTIRNTGSMQKRPAFITSNQVYSTAIHGFIESSVIPRLNPLMFGESLSVHQKQLI